MVTTLSLAALALGGLAAVYALWRLARPDSPFRAKSWSAPAWGMVSVLAAGAVLLAGGGYRLFGYYRDEARKEETSLRYKSFVDDPVKTLFLLVDGTNAFHERPDECLLRLEVTIASDRKFISELTGNELKVPASGSKAARQIDWPSVIDAAKDAKGKAEAEKLVKIGDWQLVQRLRLEIVERSDPQKQLPRSVQLLFNGPDRGPAVFTAAPSPPEKSGESWVTSFKDTRSPKFRIDSGFRAYLRPEEPTAGQSLTVSFIGGGLLVGLGAVLLLLGGQTGRTEPAPNPTAQNGGAGTSV